MKLSTKSDDTDNLTINSDARQERFECAGSSLKSQFEINDIGVIMGGSASGDVTHSQEEIQVSKWNLVSFLFV